MGLPDTVPGILAPYLCEFRVWGCEGKTYKQHDLVPSVGMADTYAVLLQPSGGGAARFLTVQENRITNLMAHQPIDGRSVFDARGRYLGRGGEELDLAEYVTLDNAVSMVEMASRPRPPVPPVKAKMEEPAATFLEPPREQEGASRVHRFWLREDLEIKLELPVDLTDEEAERVAAFVTTLPLTDRKNR